MDTATVLTKLMQARLVHGKPITPNRLATDTKIAQSTMWRILKGETTDVKTRLLEKLGDYFGVTSHCEREPKAASGQC